MSSAHPVVPSLTIPVVEGEGTPSLGVPLSRSAAVPASESQVQEAHVEGPSSKASTPLRESLAIIIGNPILEVLPLNVDHLAKEIASLSDENQTMGNEIGALQIHEATLKSQRNLLQEVVHRQSQELEWLGSETAAVSNLANAVAKDISWLKEQKKPVTT
ncbi:hypothetical protein AMTR_s00020p00194440 [Amborella trichopoda]|uniref:Uncharacterized protein n=1 Tax=Amborella trichopoda TaxID=13333 RepID=W1PUZ3_AMBTC|nr:hypothetical protein AMTR_s00020p00194440 [Amborella trichopoda]